MYTLIDGTLGVLLPLVVREDLHLLQQLEAHLRAAALPLLGLSHLRHHSSAQGPPLRVIDGDLCQRFPLLPALVQRQIAAALGRDVDDILRKLEDVRKTIL